MGVTSIEALGRRAAARRLTVHEVRDALVSWFMERAEPQIRKGMRYTAPRATKEEIRRVMMSRARGFFVKLGSTYDDPTWADLRRVKSRMDVYLRNPPPSDEQEVWEMLLA